MAIVDAVVTAGGKGTRIRDVDGEKPLIDVIGTPLIGHVLRALRSSASIGDIFVTVSDNTPRTKEYLEAEGAKVIMTSGAGYVEDLNRSMHSPSSDHVLVCPSDMPLLTGIGIDTVVEKYFLSGVGSYSVTVPKDMLLSLGLNPTYSICLEGREVVLCGVSVVNRKEMLSMESLNEGYMISDSIEFALNVNTLGDLKRAESMLRERSQRLETSRA